MNHELSEIKAILIENYEKEIKPMAVWNAYMMNLISNLLVFPKELSGINSLTKYITNR